MSEQDQAPDTPRASPRALTLDLAAYRHHLADTDWTDEQKDQFIEALWTIVVGFVDRGFGLEPVQQVTPIAPLDQDSGAMVAFDQFSNSNDQQTASTFTKVAQRTDS